MINGLELAPCHSVLIIYPSLTQDEDARAGFHCSHAVGGDALPHTLVVLHQRLQEQGTVGQYGVQCVTHQVDLQRIKHTDAQFLQIIHLNIHFLILGFCTHKLSAQVDLKIIPVNVAFPRSRYKQRGSETLYLPNCESLIIFH